VLYGIAAATSALLLAAVLAALLRLLALRLGVVERRRARAVPLLGGVAVVVVTAFVAGVGDWTGVAPLGPAAGRLLAAGIGVGALGLVVDLWPPPALVRVPLQAAVVTGAAALTVPYDELGPVAGAVAVGWIALATHAFTSLDHADGVMGTVAVVTAFALSGCAAAEVMDGLAALLSVLAAALTGFLMHNWPPARIVPGRCGALFVGFVLTSAAVLVHTGREAGSSAGAGFALTAVATVDAVLVLVSRRRAGRPLLRGAPDHLVHRLRRLGVTPQGAAVVVGITGFADALVGLLIDMGWVSATAALWLAGGAGVAVLALLRIPTYGGRHASAYGGRLTAKQQVGPPVRAHLRVSKR
jgi:UDP-GlcNAc:undecaprenyl-phosphate GlcNAc-1-phosphate transferase